MRRRILSPPALIYYKSKAGGLQAQPATKGEMKVKSWKHIFIFQKSGENLTNPNYNEDNTIYYSELRLDAWKR